ncbi:uncharacterized protein BDW43DRAFT_101862 [Aspergillus alliaceus]|uniref:uncharacterized protein n=1 Tax=Petromyces alliaceus TaxID=209559 RepID=UPI0012A5BD72|nr:uncharacterized protein BDW43DRAFT_101862 [Aspergillus alliaceus]KAB8232705.1 hypothetical protein BDW43DRAFT_101862 [Aspergillus alliaceus]
MGCDCPARVPRARGSPRAFIGPNSVRSSSAVQRSEHTGRYHQPQSAIRLQTLSHVISIGGCRFTRWNATSFLDTLRPRLFSWCKNDVALAWYVWVSSLWPLLFAISESWHPSPLCHNCQRSISVLYRMGEREEKSEVDKYIHSQGHTPPSIIIGKQNIVHIYIVHGPPPAIQPPHA